MKKNILAFLAVVGLMSCATDEMEMYAPIPNDVTLNELQLERFTHKIPDGGFTAKANHSNSVTFNTKVDSDGSYSGFAYSNRNNRSFTWGGSQESLDSNIYSVYTQSPNRTKVYAVGHIKDDDAFFTLETPTVVENILVANTTYTYLALSYGDTLGTAKRPRPNPNIPDGWKKAGIWLSYVPGGVKAMSWKDKDYCKLIIQGFKDGKETGKVEFYLCVLNSDPEHPNWWRTVDNWYPCKLDQLGVVDKVVFHMESTDIDKETGRMRTPAYFCLDGIRLREV